MHPSLVRSIGPDRLPIIDGARESRSPGLISRLRERIRYLHYSLRTEQAYVYWTRSFIRYCGMRHPRELGQHDVERFLAHLANEHHVSVSTHKQASCALLFLYREVLGAELPSMQELGRPKSQVRVPGFVARRGSAAARCMSDIQPARLDCPNPLWHWDAAHECLKLRTKDVEFDRSVLIVQEGKGGKDRVVMLPRR